jgi:hypothetical protein
VTEDNSGVVTPYHLIDDFLIGRNIAKYGLKFAKLNDILEKHYPKSWFFWHDYTITAEKKALEMRKILNTWSIA